MAQAFRDLWDWMHRNPVEAATWMAAWVAGIDFLLRRVEWLRSLLLRAAAMLWRLLAAPMRCACNRAYARRIRRLRFFTDLDIANNRGAEVLSLLSEEAALLWRKTHRHPERHAPGGSVRIWVWNVVRRRQFPTEETNSILAWSGGYFGPDSEPAWTPIRRFAVLLFLRSYAFAQRGIYAPGRNYLYEPS